MVMYRSKKYPKIKIKIKHELECLDLVFQIIDFHEPEVFIELGTLVGGVALALNEKFNNLEIFTYDSNQKKSRKTGVGSQRFCSPKVHFVRANLLKGRCGNLIHLLGTRRKKILYCDNGNKSIELEKFSGYLNEGDVVGVHDWLTRPNIADRSDQYRAERLESNGVLENTSIADEDKIIKTLEDRGFEKYHWDIFEKYPKVPWDENPDILLTDGRASSRFWIKT